MSPPQLVIVGGPNGAGKTTFALEYAAETNLDYLGADAIADEMSPANSGSVQIAAARTFIDRLKNALAQCRPLVIESTLSGRMLHRHIQSARQNGYRVTIIFVFLATETGCLARIQERVARGGHNVPEEDVRRRFPRTSGNSGQITVCWRTTGLFSVMAEKRLSWWLQGLARRPK